MRRRLRPSGSSRRLCGSAWFRAFAGESPRPEELQGPEEGEQVAELVGGKVGFVVELLRAMVLLEEVLQRAGPSVVEPGPAGGDAAERRRIEALVLVALVLEPDDVDLVRRVVGREVAGVARAALEHRFAPRGGLVL